MSAFYSDGYHQLQRFFKRILLNHTYGYPATALLQADFTQSNIWLYCADYVLLSGHLVAAQMQGGEERAKEAYAQMITCSRVKRACKRSLVLLRSEKSEIFFFCEIVARCALAGRVGSHHHADVAVR